jgi:hypothetical protein
VEVHCPGPPPATGFVDCEKSEKAKKCRKSVALRLIRPDTVSSLAFAPAFLDIVLHL